MNEILKGFGKQQGWMRIAILKSYIILLSSTDYMFLDLSLK